MFPDKTKYLKRPIGWRDLGKVKKTFSGYDTWTTLTCPFCKSTVRWAKEENNIFGYCKHCEIKINMD